MEKLICPLCKENGEKSTVQGGHGISTAMYCPSHYDEDGNYHIHDMNTTTMYYTCSKGHGFSITAEKRCPSYPKHCDFFQEGTVNFEKKLS